jgi:hypothetical protein
MILSCGSARAQTGESPADITLRANALNIQGVETAGAGQYAAAVEQFRQAIRLPPDYAIAYGNLGFTSPTTISRRRWRSTGNSLCSIQGRQTNCLPQFTAIGS